MPKKFKPVLRFVYSYPYEDALLALVGKKLTRKHNEMGREKAKVAQKIWNKYEKEVLGLFREMYEINIPEKLIKVYISLVLSKSYSDPMTISMKNRLDLEENSWSKRDFVYTTIHELAHYFAYTRDQKQYFNRLYTKIQKINLLGKHGANLHYLIQAVEFGIVGEVFGSGYAEYSRNWVIENRTGTEYGDSAKLLKEHNIPLNKTCLKFVDNEILKRSVR